MKALNSLLLLLFVTAFSGIAQNADSTQNKFSIGFTKEIYYGEYWKDHWAPMFEASYKRKIKRIGFQLEGNYFHGMKGSKRHPVQTIEGFVDTRDMKIISLSVILPWQFLITRKFPISIGTGVSGARRHEIYIKHIINYPTSKHIVAESRQFSDYGLNLFAEYEYNITRWWSITAKANYKYFFTAKPMFGIGLNTGFHF